ncbi:transcription factor MYBS3 [Cynara cardunculus var. scolymus]|uniref:Homeodomain-like protein n=1 Tax=Cynara cardunculus var. scolymus TaxID=59895 RepID=A0A103XNT4_CYNCS|nr:transcription factor MYBS3 [Cynara cardunculus var. scolymus]KVH93959.1 Homeodomain-like protein [Cynara cardunculus var. scolymus]
MGRKCSHCGNIGHNSRTCTSYNRTIVNNNSTVHLVGGGGGGGGGGLRLFGVQLDSPSHSMVMMKKCLSLDCLPSSSPSLLPSASASQSPSSSLSSSRVSVNDLHKNTSVGYLSDGLIARAQERKKGLPWSEDEHRRFLTGLEKLGKGDWRGISRNFVTTRTPTQVASHAQKYFLRQATLVKKKRRSSLFDLVRCNGIKNAKNHCVISRSSSFDDDHRDQSDDLSLMDFNSLKQENIVFYNNPIVKSYQTTSIYSHLKNASPSGTIGSKSGTLDLELTLASPKPMDQNKSSTPSLQLGPIISVI